MLASPIYPTPAPSEDRDATQYRPAKDIEAFKQLLPPPVEFIEGSSSGTLAVTEGKYQPINPAPKALKAESSETLSESSSSAPAKESKPQQPSQPAKKSLFTGTLQLTWPPGTNRGVGLNNIGNTCFLNSALQCLLHTPPLMHLLGAHTDCRKKGPFCMACSMRSLMEESFQKKYPITPYQVANNLQHIAKHMRRGRQEDSHEFLRYAIDALQKSCLFAFPPILDLSVDIYGVNTLTDALRKFVAVDHLKGADKYKCDKCKKHVSADKQFTIHEAPTVLSIHLKRFSPMGRKIGHQVNYGERISLQSFMSEGQHGPVYSLYGVISHAGGGPNSGHYYAHIKSAKGVWFEMNDEVVSQVSSPPTSLRSAYVLFYMREKGQTLKAALATPVVIIPATNQVHRTPMISGMKKRKTIVESEDEDETPARSPTTPKLFIGPRLPSPPPMKPPTTSAVSSTESKKMEVDAPDPQAEALKRKIAKVQSGALLSLSQYNDSGEDDDVGEKDEEGKDEEMKMDVEGGDVEASPKGKAAKSIEGEDKPSSSPPPPVTPPPKQSTAIPCSVFYGSSTSKPKRKGSDDEDDDDSDGGSKGKKSRKADFDVDDPKSREWARTPLSPLAGPGAPSNRKGTSWASKGGNPYSRLNNSNNLRESRDMPFGKKSPHVTQRYSGKRRFAV
ncbi:hypothetical protein NLI96_g5854 [Meripilus lineatus]|uniref:Ubiquitin carboxyl-terminal hydrolase n=1 Tax=Meripilus lineatus TaxID=2056292 RepID=A0AAD5V4D6_9APHY|nr:hypothetical protein NLI96_g5854 [Physisporinus lineatus]